MRFFLFLMCLSVMACSTKDVKTATEPVYTFSAQMVPENVVTGNPEENSNATGGARLTLMGNELTVTGEFEDLTSELRDLEEKPGDPGVHIHPGAEGEENSYLYGLEVKLHQDGRSGTFFGTFQLSDEEVALLVDGKLYIDVHTVEHDPGELRDQIRPFRDEEFETFLSTLTVDPNSVSPLDLNLTMCK
jgi:hypothetical protein